MDAGDAILPPGPSPALSVCLLAADTPQNPRAGMGLSMPPWCTCPQDCREPGKSLDPRVLLAMLGRGLTGHVPWAVSLGELPQVGCGGDPSALSPGLSLASGMDFYPFLAILALSGGTR